jgi:hypothetical protein
VTRPKPVKAEKRAPKPIGRSSKAMRCVCGHQKVRHVSRRGAAYGTRWDCTATCCDCGAYRPEPARSSKPARSKRPRRQRKTRLGAAKRTLWDYFSKYIKARDGSVCFTCDAHAEGDSLHAGHMFPGRSGSMLYDPLMVFSQCAGCNRGKNGNAAEFATRYIDRFGIEQFQAAAKRASRKKQWTLPEVLELKEALRRGGADYECLYMEKHGL